MVKIGQAHGIGHGSGHRIGHGHENEMIHINCLNHKYEDGTNVNLCDTHFCAKYGEIVVITGLNGSGKSTMLNHMVGLLEPTKGVIKIMGVDVASKEFEEVRREIGVVFQDVDEQLIAPTVFEDIAFTPLNYGIPEDQVREMVEKTMKRLKIENLRNKVTHYLSGGEKKKVALAGAVVMGPKLLVLDELFANMDSKSKDAVSDFLLEINRDQKVTIIMTSHEEEIVRKLKARIVNL
jgi:cobalt/nickel transport system ATP-binding protein